MIGKKELDEKIEELNNYPLYREYNNTLSEINEEIRLNGRISKINNRKSY